MIELTPKEVEGIGYNRYFSKKRLWWSYGLILISLAVAIGFMALTQDKINDIAQSAIGVVIMLGGFSYYIRILFKASKEGKKLLAEWQKEKVEAK